MEHFKTRKIPSGSGAVLHMNFDLKEYIRKFEESGFKRSQAELLAQSLSEMKDRDIEKLATREQVVEIKRELEDFKRESEKFATKEQVAQVREQIANVARGW